MYIIILYYIIPGHWYIILYNIILYQAIGVMSRVFTNGLRELGSNPGRVIPMTWKMLLDATQHYKVSVKAKVEEFREWSSALPDTSV